MTMSCGVPDLLPILTVILPGVPCAVSGTPHDIVIDGKGKGEVVQNGGVSQFQADFAAGSYTFYCSVPGHRQAGMQGKLTVK